MGANVLREPNQTFDPLEAVPVKEAARLLHVSEPTVRKHIKAGELPSILIGRCRRIRRTDVEAFLQARSAYGWYAHESTASSTGPMPGSLSREEEIPF